MLAAPLVPAAYYFVLGHTDASWELGAENYSTPLDFTMTWRRRSRSRRSRCRRCSATRAGPADLGERILWLWAPLGVALYLFPGTPVRFHAFNGVSIPLAILAVRGLAPYVARTRRGGIAARVVAAGAWSRLIALLVLPGTVDRVRSARGAVYLNQQPYNLEPGEATRSTPSQRPPGPGGVMAPVDFAALVPYRTGRETWVATPSWSPDFGPRAAAVANLFAGRLPPAQARALVESSGVRFVVADCRTTTDLSGVLGPLVDARRYGCATVYEVTSRRAAEHAGQHVGRARRATATSIHGTHPPGGSHVAPEEKRKGPSVPTATRLRADPPGEQLQAPASVVASDDEASGDRVRDSAALREHHLAGVQRDQGEERQRVAALELVRPGGRPVEIGEDDDQDEAAEREQTEADALLAAAGEDGQAEQTPRRAAQGT